MRQEEMSQGTAALVEQRLDQMSLQLQEKSQMISELRVSLTSVGMKNTNSLYHDINLLSFIIIWRLFKVMASRIERISLLIKKK